MSLVIAIKDKDRVVFGADKQASTGFNKSHDTTKIWPVADLPGALMGSVGSMRASQIIQYSKIIDLNDFSISGIDTCFILNSLVPSIINVLKANGVCCTVGEEKEHQSLMIPNTFLFAYEDKAWMIWNDLSVSELDKYLAIGSGSDVANGALYATKDKNPFERIVTSIDAAAETTLYVDNGVDLLATKVYPKDKKMINEALGIEDIILKEKHTDATAKDTENAEKIKTEAVDKKVKKTKNIDKK